MKRFRSLRWRLTFFYLGLFSVLLLLLGVAQYFGAREVLFRSNAAVMVNDYKAVLSAFVAKVKATHPPTGLPSTRPTPAPALLRARLLSQAFATELKSQQISAAIYDLRGGQVTCQPATVGQISCPSLTTNDYLNAVHRTPKSYYLAAVPDSPQNYLVSLNIIRTGTRPVGIAQLSVSTSDIDQTLGADRSLAIAGSLIVLLIAAIVTPVIVGRALRPLGHMSKTAGALAAGDYKQRVAVPATGDEIGTLAVAFNQMAVGIDQAFEIRRQSEERMRQFVADASHELRTPLTSIAGYIDVLTRRDHIDADTLRISLTTMQAESARMTRLVNDLLTLTRFESGKEPSRRPVPLDTWLTETLNELRLPEQGAHESRRLAPGIVVRADPDALKQVVINLAQNALKYAPGAEQHWSCFAQDGRAAIRLQDTGPGIPRGDLPHIFERFYRGEKARDRPAGGSGLGLAIAKSIVEAQGGTIEADSAPGEGATFTAWLPLAA